MQGPDSKVSWHGALRLLLKIRNGMAHLEVLTRTGAL